MTTLRYVGALCVVMGIVAGWARMFGKPEQQTEPFGYWLILIALGLIAWQLGANP